MKLELPTSPSPNVLPVGPNLDVNPTISEDIKSLPIVD